jgi:hypothetical protein
MEKLGNDLRWEMRERRVCFSMSTHVPVSTLLNETVVMRNASCAGAGGDSELAEDGDQV